MTKQIPGIHHVTAITSDAQRNIDFYTGLLGLRLVKLTVNFDDPGSYHLYYGDAVGHPGTIMTFFAWPGAPRGRQGMGQVISTAFSIPETALDYWVERLTHHGVTISGPTKRFDEQILSFADPDGLSLELVAHSGAEERSGWTEGPVPDEHTIRGFRGVTLAAEGYERTAVLLTQTLGFRPVLETNTRFRYQANSRGPGPLVDLLVVPNAPYGRIAAGTVHHVAWRTLSDEEQLAWREEIVGLGYNVTPVMDRVYFHSIYFREPGGVLFEIATDPPGFTVDETPENLGTQLKLPPWLEPVRAQIEQALPPVRLGKMAERG